MTKQLIAASLVFFLALNLCACGPSSKTIQGITYQDYGLLNEDEVKNLDIQYEPDWWNIFWGVMLAALIVPPIYVLGYHLMKPVGLKPEIKGTIPQY